MLTRKETAELKTIHALNHYTIKELSGFFRVPKAYIIKTLKTP